MAKTHWYMGIFRNGWSWYTILAYMFISVMFCINSFMNWLFNFWVMDNAAWVWILIIVPIALFMIGIVFKQGPVGIVGWGILAVWLYFALYQPIYISNLFRGIGALVGG